MGIPTTERAAIKQAIRAIVVDGWELVKVNDGEEMVTVSNVTSATRAIMAVDEAWLYVRKGDVMGGIYFVLGNSPDEVICDYTINLEILDTLFDSWMS